MSTPEESPVPVPVTVAPAVALNWDLLFRNSLGRSKAEFAEFKKSKKPAAHLNSKGLNLLMVYFEYAKIFDPEGAPGHIIPALRHLLQVPGCDVNNRDCIGRSILHLVAQRINCPLGIFEVIIEHGADVNAYTKSKFSVLGLYLHMSKPHNPAVVHCLLKNGFDTRVLNKQ